MRKSTVALAAILMAAGCGAGDEFDQATPDTDSLMAEVTGDSSEGVSSSSSNLSADYGQQEQNLSATSEYLTEARRGVAGLNAIVRSALTPIVELIAKDPGVANGTVKTWGPADRGNATYKFTMKKAAEKKYGWKLEGKAKGAADTEYRVVMAGGIALGAEAHRGKGLMGIDGDAFAAIDPDIHAAGKLLVGFAHGANGGKALAYLLKEFSPDTTKYQTVSAALQAVRGPAGGTIVRMATYSDINGGGTDGTNELVLSRVRWLPGVGGRVDAVVGGGDVPDGHFYAVNACWNAQQQQGFELIRDCLRGQPMSACTVKSTQGQLSNCATDPRLGEQLPSTDPNASDDQAADEGQSNEAPPALMPDGSGL